MGKEVYHICEYGVIRSLSDYGNDSISTLEELYLPEEDFESIYVYISKNQEENTESEKPFLLFSKGKRKQIKVKNYVGVIETKEKFILKYFPRFILIKVWMN